MTNQSKKRKFLASTLTATMVAAAVAPVAGVAAADNGSFPDVPADHDYAGVIADMVNADIIEGLPNGNFDLGGTITRAQAAQMVAGLLDLATGEEGNRTSFEDVKSDVWYTGAVNSLVAEGIVAGKTATLFAPGADITRGELAQLLVEAYGLADVNVDDVELPFTDVDEKAWFAKPIKILYSQNLIKGQTATKFGPKDNMKRGDFAWLAANVDYVHGEKLPKPAPAEIAVESVSAINAKTLAVKLNNDVTKDEAEELELSVERNGVTTLFNVDSVDGNVVNLVRATGSNLLAGTYVVTLDETSATVEVQEQTLTDIEVGVDSVPTNAERANLGIKVLDQYGEELDLGNKGDYTWTVKNITKDTTRSNNVDFDYDNEYFYLSTTGQDGYTGDRFYDIDDKIQITFVHNESGLSTTKTITVTEGAEITSIDFGDVVLPEDVNSLSEEVEGVKIPYTAKDQYGNDVPLERTYTSVEDGEVIESTLPIVTLVSSDTDVLLASYGENGNISFEEDEDGNKFIVINKFEGYGDVVLRLIDPQTGKVFNYELEVLQEAGLVHSVELAQTELDIAQPADNTSQDDIEPVYVDVTVTDNYGNELEPKDYVNEGFYTINSSNESIVKSAEFEGEGDNAGKLGVVLAAGAEEGDTATVTVTVNETGETATLQVSVGEQAELSEVTPKDYKANLINGSSTTVEFELLDQYGNKIALAPGQTISYEPGNEEDAEAISVVQDTDNNLKFTVNAEKSGSQTLTLEVLDTDGKTVVASGEATFKVVANNTEDLTFEVEDIPTLYGLGEDGYAEKINVIATDSLGNEYVIPEKEILSIKASGNGIVTVDEEDHTISGNLEENHDFDENQTVTLTVVFNADNAVETITKDVTVSIDKLAASSVEFYSNAKVDEEDTLVEEGKLHKDVEAVSTITVEDVAALEGKSDVYAVVQDQFNRYTEATADGDDYSEVDVAVTNQKGITITTGPSVTAEGQLDFTGLAATKATEDTEEASFRVVLTTGNSVVGYVEVVVNNVSDLETAEGAEATADVQAVANAKQAISDGIYTDLNAEETDPEQDGQTEAVQKAVDEVVNDETVTVVVTYNTENENYEVEITKNGANDTITIESDDVTFL